MDRRNFLAAGAATLTASPALAAATTNSGERQSHQVNIPAHFPPAGKRPLPVNKQRAYDIMEKYQIDGIVALRPHNVYYLSNVWPASTPFGTEYPAMATMARDPSQPSFFIGSTGATWEAQNGDKEIPEIMAFSGVKNWRDYLHATPEQMRIEPEAVSGLMNNGGFAVKAEGPFTDREAAWKLAQETYNPTAAPSIEWALVRALKESGISKGRVAVDDMRIAYLLQQIGFDSVTCIPGDSIFRDIRLIKQPHELALMQRAQIASQNAARAAAHALQPGMTYAEARARFSAECAANGADIAFLLLGVTQALLPDAVVREGRSYMIDCGAYHHHYMGDYARTISIGDPSETLKKRFRAQQIGRAAALEIMRPGVSFTEIERTAREAMIKAGMPANVIAASYLHSVGLQHDDQPSHPDSPHRVRGDMILEKNMAVTLDLPFLEIGWGAGHNEDLLLITETGYELMNSADEPLIIV